MRIRKQKRFAMICSFLIAASVLFSPLTHALLMSSPIEKSNVETTSFQLQAEQPCHHHDSMATSNLATNGLDTTVGEEGVDHCNQLGASSTCKILCSVFLTAIPFPPNNLMPVQSSSDRFDYYSDLNLALISIPPFKPPRL